MLRDQTPDGPFEIIVIAEEETQAERLRVEFSRVDDLDVDIRLVSDIGAATDLLDEQSFDAVVITHSLLPAKGDGLESLDAYFKDLPVVGMMEGSDFRTEHEALGSGVDEILYLPRFDGDRLIQALSRARTRNRVSWTHRRMQRAVEQSDDGFVITDSTIEDDPIVFANRGFERMSGYTEDEILGRNCRFLQCEATSEETVNEIGDALEREEPIKVVIRNERRSGERFWNELALTPVENPEGDVTEYVGRQRDVTERVELKRELARKNTELASYRMVVEHANDAIYFKDDEGRYRLVNETVEALFEQNRGELLGSTDYELFDDETAEKIRKSDERVRRTGESKIVEWSLDFPDGTHRFLLSVFPDELPSGETGIVGIGRDITGLQPLDQQALYDHLTGLPTRDLFRNRIRRVLESAGERPENFALGILDVNDFDVFNQNLGHEAGDTLLEKLADRLRSGLSDAVIVARLDSDEFGLFLPSVETRADLERLTDRFEEMLEPPFEVGDSTAHLSVSIGFAFRRNAAAESKRFDERMRHLMTTATDALARAQESPKTSSYVLTPEENSAPENRVRLEHEMRVGIVRDQFEPYYQPIFTLDGGIHAIELLARWNHPERGSVPPSEFIPIAERAGFLDALTEHMVEETYESLWRADVPAGWPDPVRLQANLSAGQLDRPDLPDRIEELATGPGADRTRLTLEITESQLLKRADQVRALSERGFPIIVDDFGTGYSSLARLKDLPLDELKLDMEFVHGALENDEHAAILRTVAELGARLDVPVVGEGVENEEQLELLREVGCDAVQGWYLGRAAPFGDFLEQTGGASPALENVAQ